MMSIKQWLVLWILFLSYLFLGAFIFYAIERRYEEHRRGDENREKLEKLEVEDLLNTYYTWTNNRAHKQLLLKLKLRCNISLSKPILESDDIIEVENEYQWTFYNSFFFALTTLSTIGYGNLHPTSTVGRILVIAYSLVGIPLNGIVLAQLGDFFASTFLRVHQRYKGRRFETRFVLLIDIATYLFPGILLFIFLPSGFFVYFEGWTFEQSIYFAYVTLTTIGYGDFVAGQSITSELWYNIYKILLLFWIMFGLGYLVMILGFISRAMRCKHMARLEHKLIHNLKYTHLKIVNEFKRDVSYVRRLLNELYLLKYKPVYQDELEEDTPQKLKQWQSLPDLRKWPMPRKLPNQTTHSSSEDDENTRLLFERQRMKRRKALSQNVFKHSGMRTRSETDLNKIDREATFNSAAYVENEELMAKVVDVFEHTYTGIRDTGSAKDYDYSYSSSNDDSDDERKPAASRKVSNFEKELLGIDIFSNDEILSDEKSKVAAERNSNNRMLSNRLHGWAWSGDETVPKLSAIDKRSALQSDSAEKRRGLPLPGMASLRRMSSAAFTFLTPGLFNKVSSKEEEAKDAEAAAQKAKRNRRTGNQSCPRKDRYSLCIDYDRMYDCLNYYTQIRKTETDILSTLKNHIGNVDKSNPILQQTSIGEFLQIMHTLTPNATLREKEPPPPFSTSSRKGDSVSPLFTLFQNETWPTEFAGKSDSRSVSLMPKGLAPNQGENRRHSLIPDPRKDFQTTRKDTSFSGRSRRPSSSKLSETSNQVEGNRKTSLGLPTSLEPSTPRRSSHKIRRFLVKPVILPPSPSVPSIVVSAPYPQNSPPLEEIIGRRCDSDSTRM